MKITDPSVLKEFTRPFNVRLREKNDRVSKAAEAIYRRWPDIVPNLSEDDAQVRLKKMALCLRTSDWTGATLGDVLVAARAAFDSRWIRNTEFDDLRKFLISEIKHNDSPGLRRVMFEIYLSTYKSGSECTTALTKSIISCREQLFSVQKELLGSISEILNPEDGPKSIAKKLIAQNNPRTALINLGLKESYDDGLMAELHIEMIVLFRPLLAQGDSIELSRFLAWLRPKGRGPRQKGAGEAINAALEPWLKTSPNASYQAALTSGLVAVYGDLRLKHSAAWQEASPESVALVRRWLAGKTMLVFMNAISNTLFNANDKAMWESRKKFWMGLYKKKLIDEAWVAFSGEAYQAAQRMAQNEQEKKLYAGFGRQIAVGHKKRSLLVMRIGRRIIVEGSYSYKVRLFEPTNAKCPKLYESAYDCARIMRDADDEKAHNGNGWQTWVMQRVL